MEDASDGTACNQIKVQVCISIGCAITGIFHWLNGTPTGWYSKRRSILFGDNKLVVTSLIIPHSGLSKCHNALSYHRVRKEIAAKILKFSYVSGSVDLASVLSKHIGHAGAWPLDQLFLSWHGQPAVIPLDAAAQAIGECQDLKRYEANATVYANMACYSPMLFGT